MAEQDEFAQTRGADDLFDDEIIPIAGDQEIQHVAESHVEHEQHTHTASVDVATASPQPSASSRRHRGGQGRGSGVTTDGSRGGGRGRGRGGRGSADVATRKENIPKAAAVATQAVAAAASATAVESSSKASNGTDATEKKDETTGGTTGGTTGEETQEGQVEEKPATTKPDTVNARVLAVRGDRSETGGIKKPKLTEEELAERMAAAKLNAAKKAAAHARAEADEASFQQREKVAAEKRRQELANRRVMDSERERNRMRKLGAQTGREWDAEKKEEDYNGRRGGGEGGSQYRRGMHGAVLGAVRRVEHPQAHDGAETVDDDHVDRGHDRGRGRGRGGRGRGRGGTGFGRGGGMTARDRSAASASQPAPGLDNESEFPSLPANAASKEATASTSNTSPVGKLSMPAGEEILSPGSPLTPAEGTWAEQVESSEAL